MNTTPKDFTERDIRLVASWVHARDCAYDECGPTDDDEDTARAILGALAEAGRLQPQPARVEIYYGIETRPGHVEGVGGGEGSLWLAKHAATRGDGRLMQMEHRYFADDSMTITPWVEVGSTPEESREDHE